MNELDAQGLSVAFARIQTIMPSLETELNEADAVLGDGDTGTMLSRMIAALNELDLSARSLDAALDACATAVMGSTGSSLGTLIGAGFLAAARTCQRRERLPVSELHTLVAAARDEMLLRGGAALGDKTIVDMFEAIARGTAGVSDWDAWTVTAATDARATFKAFRPLPCKIGRARLWPEKSAGRDDPGMLAAMRIIDWLTARGAPGR